MKKNLIIFTIILITINIAAKTEIYFWHVFDGSLRISLEGIINEFNSSQRDIEIKLVSQKKYSTIFQKLKSLIKYKGKMPDIFLGYSSWLSQFPIDKLYKCNDLLSKEKINRIHPQLLKDASFNDIQYGLPFNKSIMLLYVNDSIISKAKINIKDYKAADLMKLLREIKKRTGKTSMAYNGSVWAYENLLLNIGGNLSDLSSSKSAAVLEMIRTGFKEKMIIFKSGFSFQKYWTDQTVPIMFSSIVSLNYMKDINFSYKRYNVLGGDTTTYSIISGSNLYVSKKDNNHAAIAKFLNWFYQKKILEKWCNKSGYLPLSKEQRGGDILKDITIILEPNSDEWYKVRKELSGIIKTSLISGESSEKLLQTLK
jgi:multiple sugar transport system substrate-binding protein